MNFTIVQILVVVANIQMGTLKAQVEKGFMRTAVDHELVGPKAEINLVNDLKEKVKKLDKKFKSKVEREISKDSDTTMCKWRHKRK